MRRYPTRLQNFLVPVLVVIVAGSITGCNTTDGNIIAVGAAAATLTAGRTPAQEIQQIYYLGIFDPQEQVPPLVYRVRVHGQASIMSGTQFGSGWVPAHIVDSLGSSVSFDDGAISITKAGDDFTSRLQTGRRLVMFGPEGFREAPKDHRLVIVMGASPDKFFEAMDQSLGIVSEAMEEQRNTELTRLLLAALRQANDEKRQLDRLKDDLDADLAVGKESDS